MDSNGRMESTEGDTVNTMPETPHDREEWLKARGWGISGTGASAIIGENPYMSNVDYWERLTGRAKAPDISGKEVVQYGLNAEHHLIELFKLDFPEYTVQHKDWDLRRNEKYPFLIGSIDGQITDSDGRNGVLEIKTANVMRRSMMLKWEGGIPTNYFYQVVHYLLVTGWDFAIVKAQLKHIFRGDFWLETRHYTITRKQVQTIIDDLLQKELAFWQDVINDRRPSLILPRI